MVMDKGLDTFGVGIMGRALWHTALSNGQNYGGWMGSIFTLRIHILLSSYIQGYTAIWTL